MTKHVAASPLVIDELNLSCAWGKALIHIIDHAGKEITPLVISIHGFDENRVVQEDMKLRIALDELLQAKKMQSVEDVAYTIFPERLWTMAGGDRSKLFELYRMVFPRYQAMNRKLNNRGLYFERLTNFSQNTPCDGNQLEWIITQYNHNHGFRRSMFQATTFDPARDHVNQPRLGFPCLQHVTFEPTTQGLVANAFYATQLLVIKGYGNYLGLAQLAAFMAHEMNVPLARLNVMVGIAKVNEFPKTDACMHPVIEAARACIADQSKTIATRMLSVPMEIAVEA
jgi:thymidylate synthase